MKTFTLSHERFVLEIDPSRRYIKGSAELTIQPLQKKLPSVRINCRQCRILGVKVNGDKAEYGYADPVSELTLGENTTVAHHHVYKSRYLNALREADEGELIIRLPEGCVKQVSESEARMNASDVYMQNAITTADLPDDPSIPDKPVSSIPSPSPIFAPVIIRVDYELENPRSGLIFVDPDEAVAPYRYHHLYTINQPLPGATRAWLPCMDRIHDRCTWDMEFIVPNKLGSLAADYEGESMNDDEFPAMVICSGEVVEQVIHPLDPSKKIVHYSLPIPTAAPFIGFAVGPFEMLKLTPAQFQEEILTSADLDEKQQQSLMAEINMMPNIYAFALPGRGEELTVSCGFLMHAMHFYAQEYGSYPFSDYKLVFVEDVWCETNSSASLAICSSRLLHPADIIDQTYHTRRVLSLALARQWFGIHIVQKSWPDAWLIYGVANLMGALFIKRHLGNSEFRLRMKRDMELCCSLDVNRPPLYNLALPTPLDLDDLEFIELKAPLVLYMLDKRMCKVGGTLGLSRVISKILVSAISGELIQNALSTHFFLKLCRKVSGFDTKTFADQWIHRSGCPKFTFSFNFNRKKMVVEFYMQQENTNSCLGTTSDNPPADLSAEGGTIDYQDLVTPLFTGNLTVRIHEADGTPYEHILDIQSAKHKFEVQFNTKYKRIRRNTKRFLAKQAAAAAAVAEEDAEKEDGEGGTTNVLGIIPALGLGMPVFEDPQQRQVWKVVEWGQDEEDTSGAASAMFDWIRLDADFEWLCVIDFQQPDYQWAGQLTKDRDVVAQYEAIEALKHMPSLPTATSLLRAVIDPKCFYKIRMEAAYALAKCGGEDMNWVGLHQLCKMFQSRYCFAPPYGAMETDDAIPINHIIPKPNNFSNFSEYFVQKGMTIAFSQVRDRYGRTPIKVRQLLLDLLKYNDNIGNEYSDSYYIATMISALGDAFIPSPPTYDADDDVEMVPSDNTDDEQLLTAAMSEIERFRTLDCVIPTYHNVVTISCIRTLTKLMLNGILEPNISLLMQYTRYGNFLGIRLCAFDSLFVLYGLSDNRLTEYFLSVIKSDPCIDVSHYVARAMLICLGPAMRNKSNTDENRFVEEFAEEEGKAVILEDRRRLRNRDEQDDQIYIENLRKRFKSNTGLQEAIWKLLNSSENSSLDHTVRKNLLQFCEYLYKPADVGIRVKIRMLPAIQDNSEDVSEPLTLSPPSAKGAKQKPTTIHKEKESITVLPREKKQSLPQIPLPSKLDRQPVRVAQPPNATVPPTPPTAAKKVVTIADTHAKTLPMAATPASPSTKPSQVSIPATLQATLPPSLEPLQQEPPADSASGYPVPKISSKKPDNMASSDYKMCRRILSKIMRHRSAIAFLQPVDEDLDGAHGYYKIIKRPMDLGKIKRNLEKGVYNTYLELENDIRLMLNNCFAYNGPGTPVYIEGQTLEAALEKELAAIKARREEKLQQQQQLQSSENQHWPHGKGETIKETPPTERKKDSPVSAAPTSESSKPAHKPSALTEKHAELSKASPSAAPPTPVSVSPKVIDKKPERPKSEKEKCAAVLAKTMESRHAYEFLRPVDPVRHGIPTYFQIIKKPIDLGTIKSKLKTNQYQSSSQFDDDVRLMFRNCFTFNKPGEFVYNQGKQLEQVYNQEWINNFGSLRKSNTDNQSSSVSSVHAAEKPVPASPAKSAAKSNGPAATGLSHPKPAASTSTNLSTTQLKPTSPKNAASKVSTERSQKQQQQAKATSRIAEINASPSKPVRETVPTDRMDDNNMRRCDRILKKIWQHPAAPQFYDPVDVEGLNLPQYYEIIKRPMDLSSVRRNLEGEEFSTIWEFERDIRQIFWNCYAFNDASSWIAQQAKDLEVCFNEEWRQEFGAPNMLEGDDFRLVEKVVTKLRQHEAALFFNEPVDLDMLPDYTKVVKNPMDLRTIWEKLESGKYTSLQQADADIRLVFTNCATYNKKETCAYEYGKRLEKYYNSNIGKELRHRVKEQVGAMPQKLTSPIVTKQQQPLHQQRQQQQQQPQQQQRSPHPTVKAAAATTPDHSKPRSPGPPPPSPTPAKTPVTKVTVSKATKSSKEAPVGGSGSAAHSHPPPVAKLHPSLVPKLQSLLNRLKNHSAAVAFLEPVDPIALNIPHYPVIIKKPMDLGTMEKKLKEGEYKSVKDFETDMRLIFTNCYTFNGFEHPVSQTAKILEKIANKEIPGLRKREEQLLNTSSSIVVGAKNGAAPNPPTSKPTAKKQPSSSSSTTKHPSSNASGGGVKAELRKYKQLLDKLQMHPNYYAFGAPVDPVLLQVPTYFDVIKHPMDFGTIRQKLDRGDYKDTSQLLKDAQQVFINCFTFNLPDDIVYQMGRDLETEFNKLCLQKGLTPIPISNPPAAPHYQHTTLTDVLTSHQDQLDSLYDQSDAYGLVDIPQHNRKRSYDGLNPNDPEDYDMDPSDDYIFSKRQKITD
ncbi:hypothetical protein BX666DRAFT_1984486 [Dichotomocladium elegans]|nr:hypothetical protein BX666DRAFT_1984486 [Dichotomocladium elegans]